MIKQHKQIIGIKTVVMSKSTAYFKMDLYRLVKKIFSLLNYFETIKKVKTRQANFVLVNKFHSSK